MILLTRSSERIFNTSRYTACSAMNKISSLRFAQSLIIDTRYIHNTILLQISGMDIGHTCIDERKST